MNFLLVWTMEDRGYAITFKDELVLIQLLGSDLDLSQVHGVIEGKLYRLHENIVIS
jgi:hypothetical protein